MKKDLPGDNLFKRTLPCYMSIWFMESLKTLDSRGDTAINGTKPKKRMAQIQSSFY
jgi:hypothetical protein